MFKMQNWRKLSSKTIKSLLLAIGACGLASAAQGDGLVLIRRIHVERLAGGESADIIRDMLIASIYRLGIFELSEDPDHADAVLRGSADDLAFMESSTVSTSTSASESDSFGAGVGAARANGVGAGAGSARVSASSKDGLSTRRSKRETERKHEATASVRLVNAAGEILWSTTQESLGAKFRSSSADVADRIAKQLVSDVEKMKAAASGKPANTNPLSR